MGVAIVTHRRRGAAPDLRQRRAFWWHLPLRWHRPGTWNGSTAAGGMADELPPARSGPARQVALSLVQAFSDVVRRCYGVGDESIPTATSSIRPFRTAQITSSCFLSTPSLFCMR